MDDPAAPLTPALEPPRIVWRWRGLNLRMLMLTVAAVALVCWLHVRLTQSSVGPVPIGIKLLFPLDITVLEDATDQPIRGARVYQPFLNPEWRGRSEMKDRDLREKLYPGVVLQPNSITGEDGRLLHQIATGGNREIRLDHTLFGLIPYVRNPQIYFRPLSGVHVTADGYEPWTAFLDDVTKVTGGPPWVGLGSSPIVVRMKRSTPRPSRKPSSPRHQAPGI